MKIRIPYLSQITYKSMRKNTKFSYYNLNLCNYGDFEIKNINDKADDVGQFTPA